MTTTKTVRYKYEKPDYNMEMVCDIKKQKDIDRSNEINIGVFKSSSRNAIK